MKYLGGSGRTISQNPESGFTVVELLITLIVAGVVFMAFATTFSGIENITKKGTDQALASAAAFSKLQQYEDTNFTNLPNTAPIGSLQQVEDFSASLPAALESPRVGKVYISTQSNTLKQIDIRVSYGGTTRIIEFVTFIQKNGIGR